MSNCNLVIGFAQIENFHPTTTARWLREYLHSDEGVVDNVDNYLAYLLLVRLIYSFMEDREVDLKDYRNDLIGIYRVRSWSPYMTGAFLRLRGLFYAEEWLILWRHFHQMTREKLAENMTSAQAQMLDALNKQVAAIVGVDETEVVGSDPGDTGP